MHRAARRRLLGTGARRPTVAFSGLFGPRGLASIVFAVLLVEDADLSGEATATNAVYVTIGLSVLLHGLTAVPAGCTLCTLVHAPSARRDTWVREHSEHRNSLCAVTGRHGDVTSIVTPRPSPADPTP